MLGDKIMNNEAPWTKERLGFSPVFCIKSGDEELAFTDEDTADKVIAARNATPLIDYKKRAEDAESELREIDHCFRVPALENLPNRIAKIGKLITIAKEVDPGDKGVKGKRADDHVVLLRAVEDFLTTWDGANATQRLDVFADNVRNLRNSIG